VSSRPLVAFPGPLVYVDDLGDPTLADEDAHHLQRVLRLRPGDLFAACDGMGAWQIREFGSKHVADAERFAEPKPEYEVGVGVPLVKGDRPEWMVQKLTEVGADRVTFITSERTVVSWDPVRMSRNLDRFRRITRSAGAQSKRAWLPIVDGPVPFVTACGGQETVLADLAGGPLEPTARNVLIGPEGGWTETERRRLPRSVCLGPQVLRAETAALVAATLLVLTRSRLVTTPRFPPRNALGG
jgi:16S rRNA (uracil1498-N3)-methyltransferase